MFTDSTVYVIISLYTVGGEYSYKNVLQKGNRIVKKTEKRLLIYMIEMVAFCTIMIFCIVYGPQHPQIFFWGVLAVFTTVIAIEIAPTLKDTIILVIGMIVLATAGAGVDKLVSHFFGNDTLIGFIVSCLLLAPFYFQLAGHFLRMCKKMVKRTKKKEELESESK